MVCVCVRQTAMTAMLKLKASDGELFEVEEVAAFESQVINCLVEDTGPGSVIPLCKVSSKILSLVIEYCRFHVLDAPYFSEEDVKLWDAEFIKVDAPVLFDLVEAANFLNIKGLLNLTCQVIAGCIAGKTPSEILKMFNLKNNFTPEEEEEIRRENQWAFE